MAEIPELKQTDLPEKQEKYMTESQVRAMISEAITNFVGTMRIQSGIIQSGNFVSGEAGWQLTSDGSLEANAGEFRGDLHIGDATGPSIAIDANDGIISLKYNNVVKGTISGYVTSSHSEDSYIRISAQSGRTMTLMESMIEFDGDVNPYDSEAVSLGNSGLKWNFIWAKNTAFGDMSFTDTHCPICKKEFLEGDCIINFIYKRELIQDTMLITTVPAHYQCVEKYDSLDHESIQNFIKLKSDDRDKNTDSKKTPSSVKSVI